MIRLATIEDARSVVNLGESYFAGSRFQEHADFNADHAHDSFRNAVINPLKHMDVLDIDGEILGFCLTVAGEQPWTSNLSANIFLLYLVPEHRTGDWSTAFVERSVNWAKEHNMDEIIIGDYALNPEVFQRRVSAWQFEPAGSIAVRRLNA